MKLKRISYEVSESQHEAINKLVKESGARNRTDYIDNALLLLKWAIGELEEGRTIASIKKDNDTDSLSYREVKLPALSPWQWTDLF